MRLPAAGADPAGVVAGCSPADSTALLPMAEVPEGSILLEAEGWGGELFSRLEKKEKKKPPNPSFALWQCFLEGC